MAFKELKTVNKRDRYSVHGWMRHEEKHLKLDNIPSMVTSICILYFRHKEIFGIINNKNGVILSPNKTIITNTTRLTYSINYGITKIPSMNKNIYKWDLRPIKDKRGGIGYGIGDTNGHRYEFDCDVKGDWDAKQVDFSNIKYKQGDKISIILDLKKCELRAMVNNGMEKIAFINLVKSKEIDYRLMVIFNNNLIGDCVEILNFTKQ